MDGKVLGSVDGTALIDGLTDNVDDSSQSLVADGNLNGITSVDDGLTTHKTLGGVEGNGAHVVATQVLGDLKNESVRSVLDFESIHDRGKFTFELHVNNGADNLGNLSCGGAENACETINVSVTSGGEFELTLRSKPGQHL
jgi:hypothetical protein